MGSGQRESLLSSAIARAKEADTGALHFLYGRYADDVHGYVNNIVRDHHEAEDITQEPIRQADAGHRQVQERKVPFSAWILRVARNAALDHMRARRQIPFEVVCTSDEGHDQVGFERFQSIRDALGRLPGDQWEVLVLRHIVGLTPLEIAGVLRKTESSIHGLHHRGLCTFQAVLRALVAAPGDAVA